MKIRSITKEPYVGDVYNFECTPHHNYFANSVLVHNCHESSTVKGKHANFTDIQAILKQLQPYTELAIGGGNPLDHLYLEKLLQEAIAANLVPNLTVNARHLTFNQKKSESFNLEIAHYLNQLKAIIDTKLIYGLGISLNEGDRIQNLIMNIDSYFNHHENIVFHAIIGITDPNAIEILIQHYKSIGKPLKLLLLGYKDYGRGIDHKNEELIAWYRHNILTYLMDKTIILCFDTLGLEQSQVKRFLSKDMWETNYLGDEGTFTFYVDAVKMQYAKASYCEERYPATNLLVNFRGIQP